MSFLAPYVLFGALAAGIPIALHFFYRSRFKNVPWAAMKFLLAALEQTSRRLKFQELLLLLLRVAILLALALALARPTLQSAGRGDASDAVLVIDRSLSMSAKAGLAPQGGDVYSSALRQFAAPDGTVTRFDRARAAALSVLASLPTGSTAQVVAAADRAELLGPLTPSRLDAARTLIEQMTLTEAGPAPAAGLEPAVVRAEALLAAGPSPGKELFVFSDMQARNFESPRLAEVLRQMRPTTAITFVRCGTEAVGNVSLVGITPQTTLTSGERADFAVLVRNAGPGAVKNLTVTLEIDGDEKGRDGQPLAKLEPGETRAVVLSGVLDKPGRHVLSARVKSDDLDGDNRFDQVIRVNDRVGVLLVDGAPDSRLGQRPASFFLSHALNPGSASTLPVTTKTPDDVSPRDLEGKEVCIVVNARLEPIGKEEGGALTPEFLKALGTFVQDGKGLLVFPGDRVEAEPYNRLLYEQMRLLPYRIGKAETAAKDKPWLIDRKTAAGPFLRCREEPGYAPLDRVEVRRLLVLEPTKEDEVESRVYLRQRDGTAAVAGRRRPGQGEVMLFTSSVSDVESADWMLRPVFLPLVQMALGHLFECRPETLNRTAGERLEWQVGKADEGTNFDLVRPDGTRERLGYPASAGGRSLLTSSELTRAGLYRLTAAGKEAEQEGPLFAVSPDVRDTEDMATLSEAKIDETIGFGVRHATAADDGGTFSGAEGARSEMTVWVLLALLAFVACEMALAWWCGRAW